MSAEPPQGSEPPTDVAGGESGAPPPAHHSHVGPWILGAAIVLVLGALLAVVVHDSNTSDTQTVINRTQSVNTTSVQRTGPTLTQTTTTVTQPPETVTAPPRTVTVPSKTGTTTAAP